MLLAFVCLDLSGQVADSVKYKSLNPDDFQKSFKSDKDAVLIDVREFFEYRKSRIKDATNIPSSGNIDLAADTIGMDKALFLYCTSGYRAKKVAVRLADKGFVKLYNLEGGIKAWKNEGLPVDRKRVRKGEGGRGEGEMKVIDSH